MLPHVRGRPITMERFPAGIDKKGFIQKDVSKGFPSWLERQSRSEEPRTVRRQGETSVHYPLANDARSLLWLANQNSITPHVWILRSVPQLRSDRDLCVFDLDPSEDDPKALRTAALAVRELLDEFGLPSYLKTSGSKGFHIVVPLDGEGEAESAWRFAHGAGAVLVKRHPEILTQEFIKADRRRPLLRRHRPQPGRARRRSPRSMPSGLQPGAPVSAPCTWEELERAAVGPQTFTLRTMAARTADVGDLWSTMDARRCSLRDATAKLQSLLSEGDWARSAWRASTLPPTSRQGLLPSRVRRRRRRNQDLYLNE